MDNVCNRVYLNNFHTKACNAQKSENCKRLLYHGMCTPGAILIVMHWMSKPSIEVEMHFC